MEPLNSMANTRPTWLIKTLRGVLLLCYTIFLISCSTSSLFNPYPEQARAYRAATSTGIDNALRKKLDQRVRSKDQLLYLQERGRITQILGDLQQSQTDYDAAINIYRANEDAAYIRLGETGAGVGALLVNDNALAYRGDDYERIMLHSLQALNYWQGGQLSAAAVEFRRAAHHQTMAAQKREKEILKASENAASQDTEQLLQHPSLSGLNTAAASVRNSIENAYAYYLAGVFREGIGDYNNALVDYKRAYQINPRLSFLPADIERTAHKQRGGLNQEALVVVAYEQGFIPPRVPSSLPIPTDHGYVMVSLPAYSATPTATPQLRIQQGTGTTAYTEVAARLSAMAARALSESMTAMVTRQTVRASLKYETQKQANESLGALGAFTAQLYHLISEQPDLRSWLTLPATAQIARFTVPPGQHTFQLFGPNGSANVTVRTTPNSVALIRVIDGAQGPLHTTVLPLLENTR